MKTIGTRIIWMFFAAVLLTGCKGNEKKDIADVVEEESAIALPNKSDTYFSEALASLDKENNSDAAIQIEKGLVELKKEGEDLTGAKKDNFDKVVDALNNMKVDLAGGKKVSANSLREMIANAEINIAHDYLSTDDVYVLEEPKEAVSNRARRYFVQSLSQLNKEEGKMKPEAKKEGEALLKEGKKLEQENKDWEQKVAQYNKKAGEYFKKHNPEYFQEEYYWLY